METASVNEFDDIEVFTGEPPSQPDMQLQTQVQAPSAVVTADQQRAIAEAQAAMIIARMNPRDEHGSYLKIIKACKRKSLAEQALYAYRRGGTLVTGESIRLAEVIIRCWGNATYGFRELARSGDTSEVEAFCWDLESNTRSSRVFHVKHFRDKAGGSKKVEAQRDIYEVMAGMAQRRVRSCITAIVPGDIVEAAKRECEKTLAQADGKPLEDRIRDMLIAFGDIGVSKEMIEARLQHKVTAIVPQEIVELKKIYRSIRDGVADRSEFFSFSENGKSESFDPQKNAPSALGSVIDKATSDENETEKRVPCPWPDCECNRLKSKWLKAGRGYKKHITQQHDGKEPDLKSKEDLEAEAQAAARQKAKELDDKVNGQGEGQGGIENFMSKEIYLCAGCKGEFEKVEDLQAHDCPGVTDNSSGSGDKSEQTRRLVNSLVERIKEFDSEVKDEAFKRVGLLGSADLKRYPVGTLDELLDMCLVVQKELRF